MHGFVSRGRQERHHGKHRPPEGIHARNPVRLLVHLNGADPVPQKQQRRHADDDQHPDFELRVDQNALRAQDHFARERHSGQGQAEEQEQHHFAADTAGGVLRPPDRRDPRRRKCAHRVAQRDQRGVPRDQQHHPQRQCQSAIERNKGTRGLPDTARLGLLAHAAMHHRLIAVHGACTCDLEPAKVHGGQGRCADDPDQKPTHPANNRPPQMNARREVFWLIEQRRSGGRKAGDHFKVSVQKAGGPARLLKRDRHNHWQKDKRHHQCQQLIALAIVLRPARDRDADKRGDHKDQNTRVEKAAGDVELFVHQGVRGRHQHRRP